MGHKNIQHAVRYTELAPDRFKDFWRDERALFAVQRGAKDLTNCTPKRSNNCGQVKSVIYFRVIGVAFCCNIALGTGGGTSS